MNDRSDITFIPGSGTVIQRALSIAANLVEYKFSMIPLLNVLVSRIRLKTKIVLVRRIFQVYILAWIPKNICVTDVDGYV